MVPAGNKAKRLSSLNHTTKAIQFMHCGRDMKRINNSANDFHFFFQTKSKRLLYHIPTFTPAPDAPRVSSGSVKTAHLLTNL